MTFFCENGGDKNERQMANNVNCKEMRFVIRNLIDVDDVSPATAPEIRTLTGDYLDLILPGKGARKFPTNPFFMYCIYVSIFPED